MPSKPPSKSPSSSRPSRVLPLLLALLALGLPRTPAGARAEERPDQPWDGAAFSAPAAEILAAARELPAPEGAAVEVLLAETSYTVESHGLTSYRQRLVYRILDPAGLQGWASVDSPWSPWYQHRPTIRARVVSPDGATHRLDPETITEQGGAVGDPDMFEDERVLRAPLPAVEAGSVVETVVSVEHAVPYFAAGETRRQWLAMTVPVRRAVVTLDSAADAPLEVRHHGLVGEPTRQRRGERTVRRFEAHRIEPLTQVPPGLPPEVPLGPHVTFSTGSSWAQVAQSYSEIVDAKIEATDIRGGESLESFLGRLEEEEKEQEDPEPGSAEAPESATGPSQWQRIEELMRELHRRVRYTGVELGEGGLIPRSPHETLARRYGDCKDKAVLLTALLRREGIPAYLALLQAGTLTDVPPDLPGLGLFNHVLVYVPGSSPLWIDPTDPYSRLGEIPSLAQGRRALVASPNTRGLLVTPTADAEDNHARELRQYHLAELGPGRVVETATYRGTRARGIRSSWAGAPREDIEEALGAYVGDAYGAGELARLDFTPPEDITRPLEMELEAERATWAVSDLDEGVVVLDYSPLFGSLPSGLMDPETGERPYDFVLVEPYSVRWEIRVLVPEALELRELPEGGSHELGPARFETTFERARDGRTVEGVVTFSTGPRRWTPEQVEAFRRAVEALDAEGASTRVLLFDQTVARHLGDGDPVAAAAEARRLMDIPPERAFPRAQLARALLTAGLGEEARRVAREATEVEPGATVGWNLLALTLTHDRVGRHYRRGFDRQGAEAAFRRSLELDPEQPVVRADLAILLEHDADGVRYGEGAELEEAVKQYRRALESGQLTSQTHINLWVALLRSGRWDELRQELDEEAVGPEVAHLRLAATALSEDPEAAAREARRLLGDSARQSQALASAGQQLLLMGRYPEAASLVEAAARRADNPAALLSHAEMLRRAESQGEPRVRTDSPRAAARSFLELILLGDEEDLERGLPRLVAAPLLELVRSELDSDGEELAAVRKIWSDDQLGGLPPQVLRDLTFATLETAVRGDGASGYTVELRAGLGVSPLTLDLWFAQEDGAEGGELRLVGGANSPHWTGRYALHLLEEGSPEEAHRWIRRAVEEASPVVPSESATDPLGGPVLAGLLDGLDETEPGGAPALRDTQPGRTGGENLLRRAASALVLLADTEALPARLAEEARDFLEGQRGSMDPETRVRFDRIRAYGALLRDDWPRLELSAGRLVEAHPESDFAGELLGAALLNRGRLERASRLAERLEERHPDLPVGPRLRAGVALKRGDVAGALEIFESLLSAPDAEGAWFNNAAWFALVLGRADQQTLRWAQQAAERQSYGSSGTLHTLAAVYAELGRAAEAHRVLLQSLELSGEDPAGPEWLVLGRLAEHFELPEAARRYYRRVEPPEDEGPEAGSSYDLARRRLELLAAEAAAGSGTAAGR